jgi:hypothetical protein
MGGAATIYGNFTLWFGGVTTNLLHVSLAEALVVLPAMYLFRDGQLRPLVSLRGTVVRAGSAVALSVVITIVIMSGFALILVPGIIISLMLFVAIPSLMVEGGGVKALARSLSLTRDYRTPLLGLAILVNLIGLLLGWLVSTATTPLFLQFEALPFPDFVSFPLMYSIATAASYSVIVPIGGISATLAFLRLKEIKEGGSAGDLLKIFA